MASNQRLLREAALRARSVVEDRIVDQRTRALLAGAVFALRRADQLGYTRRDALSVFAKPVRFTEELRGLLYDLAQHGSRPPRRWMAGFYFGTGLERIAAAAARLECRTDDVKRVRDWVDWFKHGENPAREKRDHNALPDLRTAIRVLGLVIDAAERGRVNVGRTRSR